jgi:hypothetical protein
LTTISHKSQLESYQKRGQDAPFTESAYVGNESSASCRINQAGSTGAARQSSSAATTTVVDKIVSPPSVLSCLGYQSNDSARIALIVYTLVEGHKRKNMLVSPNEF